MTNRREFLQIGASATAWPFVARTLQATGIDARPELVPVSLVVYDTRFPQSVDFADRCAAAGLETCAIQADMTRLWYDEIYHRWQKGPVAIAGLTAHGPMFCFTELARDVRMRLVFRAEHQTAADGATHRLSGPAALVAEAAGACERRAFGTAMAGIITRCPIGRTEITSAQVGDAGTGADEHALYTWLIAPAVRG